MWECTDEFNVVTRRLIKMEARDHKKIGNVMFLLCGGQTGPQATECGHALAAT